MERMESHTEPDVIASNHGSLWLLTPVSADGNDWFDANVGDDALWLGGGVAVDPRCVQPILDGLHDAGLRIA